MHLACFSSVLVSESLFVISKSVWEYVMCLLTHRLGAVSVQDMGLSPAEVKEMTAAWSAQQAAVHRKIVAAGGFDWALFNCKSAPTGTKS